MAETTTPERQLTKEQLAFAEVIGRALAKQWIKEQEALAKSKKRRAAKRSARRASLLPSSVPR